jgi:hypothetical protein
MVPHFVRVNGERIHFKIINNRYDRNVVVLLTEAGGLMTDAHGRRISGLIEPNETVQAVVTRLARMLDR